LEYAREPYLWESIYQLAVTEKEPIQRDGLLVEATTAMLLRAQALELGAGSNLECAALEEAAEVLRERKLNTQYDCSGRHL
jgi:hypothetical protein